jgi:hypothetical protein
MLADYAGLRQALSLPLLPDDGTFAATQARGGHLPVSRSICDAGAGRRAPQPTAATVYPAQKVHHGPFGIKDLFQNGRRCLPPPEPATPLLKIIS